MSIFAVIALKESAEELERQIEAKIGDNASYQLKADAWLVDYDGTAHMLAEHLGIRGGESGTGIVFTISNYSGRASPDIWEWLKIRFTRRAG